MLFDRTDVLVLEDLAESHSQFDAAVYPSLLVARRRTEHSNNTVVPHLSAGLRTRRRALRWIIPRDQLPFDNTLGSPWVLIPPRARTAFDRVVRAGEPLFKSVFGRP